MTNDYAKELNAAQQAIEYSAHLNHDLRELTRSAHPIVQHLANEILPESSGLGHSVRTFYYAVAKLSLSNVDNDPTPDCGPLNSDIPLDNTAVLTLDDLKYADSAVKNAESLSQSLRDMAGSHSPLVGNTALVYSERANSVSQKLQRLRSSIAIQLDVTLPYMNSSLTKNSRPMI